ncbi:MAG: hypothetical protein ABEJ34_06495 [Haloferacaceae archaeon]
MALDAEDAGTWLARWWAEAVLAVLVLVGAVSGLRRGDAVTAVVAVALAAAVVDRIRLRLDNRSLAVAVGEVRRGVSAARGSAVGDTAGVAGEAGTPDAAEGSGEAGTADAAGAARDETRGARADRGTDDREPLDREDIADLLGKSDPQDVDAEDVAELIDRAESDWGLGGPPAEGTDERADEGR